MSNSHDHVDRSLSDDHHVIAFRIWLKSNIDHSDVWER